MGEWTYVRDKQLDALKRSQPVQSPRNKAYGEAMDTAVKKAGEKGELGKGFGGEKPFKAPPVMGVRKQGFKPSRY